MSESVKETGLIIPEGQEWPVQGRDPETGGLIIQEGFVDAVEQASGLEPATLTEEDVFRLLIIWYLERLDQGYPRDQAMDELVEEELSALAGDDEEDEDDGGSEIND